MTSSVIGGSDADEGIHSQAAGGQRADFELLDRQPDVLVIEPERVKSARHADHLHDVVVEHAADSGGHHQFVAGQALFDGGEHD